MQQIVSLYGSLAEHHKANLDVYNTEATFLQNQTPVYKIYLFFYNYAQL